MFNFGRSGSMDRVFDHLDSRAEARKGLWTVTENVDVARLQELKLKADFVDALLIAGRDMTFPEASEFLISNGRRLSPGDVMSFFEEEGVFHRMSPDEPELTDEGRSSGYLRIEESQVFSGCGVARRCRPMFVTVKGQLFLAEQFLFNNGKGGK